MFGLAPRVREWVARVAGWGVGASVGDGGAAQRGEDWLCVGRRGLVWRPRGVQGVGWAMAAGAGKTAWRRRRVVLVESPWWWWLGRGEGTCVPEE